MTKGSYIIILLVLGTLNYCNAQNVDKNKFSAIISLNEGYKRDVSTAPNSYGDVYLVTSNKAIESTLLSLCINRYITQQSIMDSLKRKFNVYTIVKQTVKNGAGVKIFDDLTNAEHYTGRYLLTVDGPNSTPGVLQTFNLLGRAVSTYKFSKVDKNCSPANSLCAVTIRKSP